MSTSPKHSALAVMMGFGNNGNICLQFHDGRQARVQNDGEYSESFPMTNGVKQGCVMAPTLFSVMFYAMLTCAFQDCGAGFSFRYRFGGKQFNLRRLQVKSKVQTGVVDELLYADDLAKNAKSGTKMQGVYGSNVTSMWHL